MTPKDQAAYNLQQQALRILAERGGWSVDQTTVARIELRRADPLGEVSEDRLTLPADWLPLGEQALLVLSALVQVIEDPAAPPRTHVTLQPRRELRILFSQPEGQAWHDFIENCGSHFLLAALQVLDNGARLAERKRYAEQVRGCVFYEVSELLGMNLGEDDDEAEADVKRRLAELRAGRDLTLPQDAMAARQALVLEGMARVEAQVRLNDLARAARPLIDTLEADAPWSQEAAAMRAAIEHSAAEVLRRNEVDRRYFLARREAELSQASERTLRRLLAPVLAWARAVLQRRDAEVGPAALDRAIVEKVNDVAVTVGNLRALVGAVERADQDDAETEIREDGHALAAIEGPPPHTAWCKDCGALQRRTPDGETWWLVPGAPSQQAAPPCFGTQGISAGGLVRRAIEGVRVPKIGASRQSPRPLWVRVGGLFGYGSTASRDICTALGFDPDEGYRP